MHQTADNRDPPLSWEDFPAEDRPKLETLAGRVAHDEWWNWPEALAWVGSRSLVDIATLRFWPFHWRANDGADDATLIAAALMLVARDMCESAADAEAELIAAVESGRIRTVGRPRPDLPAEPLEARLWRGGQINMSKGGCCLASAKEPVQAWAYDVAVNRADLVRQFEHAPNSPSRSTGAAEAECRNWLIQRFADDPQAKLPKVVFREAALREFSGRLTARGFDLRVWPNLAAAHGRTRRGAKKKS